MLSISDAAKTAYKQNRLPNVSSLATVHLYIVVVDTGTVITDNQIESENFTLEESICSEEEIYFGACEASHVKFAVYNVSEALIGKQIHIYQTVQSSSMSSAVTVELGYYYVSSESKRDGNVGLWKDIEAYDVMTKIDDDVLDWWKDTLWDGQTSLTVGAIWKALLTYLGISYTAQTLANDDKVVTEAVNPSTLTARNVLQACGELSGVFGHINRSGVFEWISIYDSNAQGLYPSETLYPSSSLYPIQLSGATYGDVDALPTTNPLYFVDESSYEDYTVQPIDAVIIQDYEGALATTTSESYTNPYIVFGNFLTWGMTSAQQTVVAQDLLACIYGITYTPNKTTMIGLPYLECGDAVRIVLQNKTITSYVFSRVLTGIVNLIDQTEALGPEYRTNQADPSKMTFALDASDAVTRVLIEKSADSILLEVSTTYATQDSVTSSIEIAVDSITSSVTETLSDYSTTTEMNSAIQQSADSITLSVSQTYQTLSGMSDYSTTTEMNSAISLAIDGITLAGKTIALTANNINITSTYFSVDTTGAVTASKLTVTGGSIKLTDSSTITTQSDVKLTIYRTGYGQARLFSSALIFDDIGNSVTDYAHYDMQTIKLYQGAFKIDATGGISGITTVANNAQYIISGTYSGTTYSTRLVYDGLSTSGDVYCNAVHTSSDERLKHDIVSLDRTTAKKFYSQLTPRRFVMNRSKNGEFSFGLIAQEVMSALSKTGLSWQDTCFIGTFDDVDGEEKYALGYEQLHAFHISMIQQQQEELDGLRAENNRLLAEIQIIKEKLNL